MGQQHLQPQKQALWGLIVPSQGREEEEVRAPMLLLDTVTATAVPTTTMRTLLMGVMVLAGQAAQQQHQHGLVTSSEAMCQERGLGHQSLPRILGHLAAEVQRGMAVQCRLAGTTVPGGLTRALLLVRVMSAIGIRSMFAALNSCVA
jgi:hypothetical protein